MAAAYSVPIHCATVEADLAVVGHFVHADVDADDNSLQENEFIRNDLLLVIHVVEEGKKTNRNHIHSRFLRKQKAVINSVLKAECKIKNSDPASGQLRHLKRTIKKQTHKHTMGDAKTGSKIN